MTTATDIIIFVIAIFVGVSWGYLLKEAFGNRRITGPRPPVTPERLNNVLLAAIFGIVFGWFLLSTLRCTVDEVGFTEPPEDRCFGVSLETCLARVTNPDAAVDQ